MLVFIAVGQVGVLQSVAWLRMLADYSRTNSVEEAVVMTFDGKHPCEMCKKLEQVREEQTPADNRIKIEIDKTRNLALWEDGFALQPQLGQAHDYFLAAQADLKTRTDQPPAPVPLA